MMSDYKSRELTLYNDGGYKLQVRPIDVSTDAGPGFSIKTTLLNGNGDWGVHIPMLKVDTMNGVRTVGSSIGTHEYKIGALETGLATEVSDRKAGDTKLQSNIDTEAGTRSAQVASLSSQIAVEVADRKTDTFNLNASISSEATARSAADTVHTNAIASLNSGLSAEVAERKSEVIRLDARILQEIQTRGDSVFNEAQLREAADVALGVRCDNLVTGAAAEVARAQAAEGKLSDRIDFITSNTNPSALDSLTEIVNNFNVNGASYASRLSYLEGVIQELLNRTR